MKEYKIPLQFKSGKFHFSELPTNNENVLLFSCEKFDILSYFVPKYKTEVRLYNITEQLLQDCLYATYNDTGQLKYVELIQGDDIRLMFISYIDDADEKAEVLDYAEQSADIISNELLKCRDKVSRLFIEYYREVEGFDFAAKIGTVADKYALIKSLGDRAKQCSFVESVIDNSGDYPHENRIECDRDTLDIMILCANPNIQLELLDMAIDVMTNIIKNNVVDKLDKADDFKFIAEEYD
ncbi:MAG: hypothetical protein K2O60_01740 [Ruminococcus sp.]|nr:hypothetical protein [Ruminococcus sp.]